MSKKKKIFSNLKFWVSKFSIYFIFKFGNPCMLVLSIRFFSINTIPSSQTVSRVYTFVDFGNRMWIVKTRYIQYTLYTSTALERSFFEFRRRSVTCALRHSVYLYPVSLLNSERNEECIDFINIYICFFFIHLLLMIFKQYRAESVLLYVYTRII